MSAPTPVGERNHYSDGSVDLFSYRAGPSAFDKAVRNICSGRARRVEIRISDGSLIAVKPRITPTTPPDGEGR